jgi:hypothetical protein
LLRDLSLTFDEEEKRWKCEHCANKISVEEIENRLIAEVERLIARFLLQDFRCSKTHLISKRLCTATSELCVPLEMDFKQNEILFQLNVLLKVAIFHNFILLNTTIQDFLQ